MTMNGTKIPEVSVSIYYNGVLAKIYQTRLAPDEAVQDALTRQYHQARLLRVPKGLCEIRCEDMQVAFDID